MEEIVHQMHFSYGPPSTKKTRISLLSLREVYDPELFFGLVTCGICNRLPPPPHHVTKRDRQSKTYCCRVLVFFNFSSAVGGAPSVRLRACRRVLFSLVIAHDYHYCVFFSFFWAFCLVHPSLFQFCFSCLDCHKARRVRVVVLFVLNATWRLLWKVFWSSGHRAIENRDRLATKSAKRRNLGDVYVRSTCFSYHAWNKKVFWKIMSHATSRSLPFGPAVLTSQDENRSWWRPKVLRFASWLLLNRE